MGRILAQVLNDRIEELVAEGDATRAEIIQEMAVEAEIDASTVNQILDESIDCPPLVRLLGFARALSIALNVLRQAAEVDGCEYGEANAQPAIERRFVTHQVRLVEEAGERFISGYAALFNQRSPNWWGFQEEIAPGAFARAIANRDDVAGLFNHEPSQVLGRTVAGTLTLREDAIGLRYDIRAPDTTYARDLIVSLERGDVNQSSFGFNSVDGGEQWTTEKDTIIRRLTDVDLRDVGPVTFAAYPQTTAEARMMAEEMQTSLRAMREQLAAAGRAPGAAVTNEPRAGGRLARRRRQLALLETLD